MKHKAWGIVGPLLLGILGVGFAPACSSGDSDEGGTGTLNLPLASEGASGTRYRLRNATFEISPNNYYYWYGSDGAGGAGTQTSVSSESEPDADTISVSLERGYYSVSLQAGWQMERVDASGTAIVEATLLSDSQTWVSIDAHSTTSADYQFGIGNRTVWLNGDLNIGVQVYENPQDYYGAYGGEGVSPGYGGEPSYDANPGHGGGYGGSY